MGSLKSLFGKQHTNWTLVLFQDILVYCERTESALRSENEALREQLKNAILDLADATKSRRVLQQQVEDQQHSIGYMTSTTELLKVYT